MSEKLSRRQLLAAAAQAAAALALTGCGRSEAPKGKNSRATRKTGPGKIAIISEKDQSKATRAAVAALGGMSAFVKKGDSVVIKPNVAWARPPDAAATTHPAVIAEIVRMCKEAGADEILIIEHTIDQPSDMVLSITGIKETANSAGVRIIAAQNESMYRKIEIPNGKILTSDDVLKDVLKADVFINVPKAKTHGETKLTLGMKNLMGINWDRGAWHRNGLHQCIVDLAGAVKADLTILDASRILLTNGPKGPGDTKDVNQIIAGTDPVAIDAYGATLFGMKPEEIEHIRQAHDAGLGEIDFKKVKIN
jgi:uncharacterized protein (DUF362 family)